MFFIIGASSFVCFSPLQVTLVEFSLEWLISIILCVFLCSMVDALLNSSASLSLCAEVSRVPGRKEALRVPPPETVAYQRPDHRL